jgi:hypothetical protein
MRVWLLRPELKPYIIRFNHAPSAFVSFVTAQPMEGLGTNIEMLERICAEDKEALDLIDQATQGKQGRPSKLENIDIVNVIPSGNARQHALRKLRKSRPDLHARVLKGKLSPHAAKVRLCRLSCRSTCTDGT